MPYYASLDTPAPEQTLELERDGAIEQALGREAPYFHVVGTPLIIHCWAHKQPEFVGKWVIVADQKPAPGCNPRDWTLPFAWQGWLMDNDLALATFKTSEAALQALQIAFSTDYPRFDEEGFLVKDRE